ncbi:MAG: DUF5667 domain-containing protein [Candidatus Daviesbacteria bacterium]|nr:DUF5667 domain-containing protein [Candidatus Daviesbacteria bacterium]
MTKFRIQLGLIILLGIFVLSLLLSMGASPDMPPFFALKRVQENLFLKFKSNPGERVDYMSNLLNSRLEELQNVVKNKNYDYVLKASLRYSTLVGRITELIEANNLTDKVEAIKSQFLEHQKILDTLYVAYPKNIPDNVEWKYIQDDFNYLKLYLDQLKKVK